MEDAAYRARAMDRTLDSFLRSFSAIAIEGAKGVGKTATARQRAATEFKLDEPEALAIVEADRARVLEAQPPVLVDEWQRHPPIWDAIRNADDRGAAPGSYLLTGSADPRDAPAHTGAGRIVRLRMRPLSLAERLDASPTVSLAALLDGDLPPLDGETDVDLERYTEEILRGGFPGLRRYEGPAHRAQITSYLDLIVEKDFPQLGQQVRNPEALRRWMAAYAAATSTTASFEKIRRATSSNEGDESARSTVIPYRDALRRLYVLDPVPAWRPAAGSLTELGDAEKHQLVDPALAARLVRATKGRLLDGASSGPSIPRDGTQLGALFESLVTLSVRVYAAAAEAAEREVRHLRTHRGDHEVDLIVEREDGDVLLIEVKLKAVPGDQDVAHLNWLAERLGDRAIDRVIVTTGRAAYRRPDGVAVVPAALLGP
ncbi:ATP-binding protein [Baekduia sp. Peel2402]|uniref:ATP-binding protein n=1 Tax=Baekduia sp. Peel2402 TaxID=3458296 RepID=UPI00403E849E